MSDTNKTRDQLLANSALCVFLDGAREAMERVGAWLMSTTVAVPDKRLNGHYELWISRRSDHFSNDFLAVYSIRYTTHLMKKETSTALILMRRVHIHIEPVHCSKRNKNSLEGGNVAFAEGSRKAQEEIRRCTRIHVTQ